MATWSPFWFFKKPESLSHSIPLSERPSNIVDINVHVVHRYDAEEIDYTLPSYSEVPSPPAYNKIILSPPPLPNDVDRQHSVCELTTTAHAEASSTHHLNSSNNNEVDHSAHQRPQQQQQQHHHHPSESSQASLTRENNLTHDSSTVSINVNNVSSLADDGDEHGYLTDRPNTSRHTTTAPAESSSTNLRKDC